MTVTSTTRRRIWRRRIMRGVICLLLGAVTTVGVAWGGMLWANTGTPNGEVDHAGRWPSPPPPGWGAPDEISLTHSTGLTRTTALEQLRSDDPLGLYNLQITYSTGWPARAMFVQRCGRVDGKWWSRPDRGVWSPPTDWRDGLEIPATLRSRGNGGRFLPTQFSLPGFLLNTLFYAAPWWLILATPAAIRRWRRHRRGRCIHCGYDLAGLEGRERCPECGA